MSESVPYSIEVEEALIGAALTDAGAYADACHIVSEQMFYILRHRMVWHAVGRLLARGADCDILTVADELRALGQLEQVGGLSQLLVWASGVPTHEHAETYAHLVASAYTRRQLLAAADAIRRAALDETQAVDDALAAATTALDAVQSPDSDVEQTADTAGRAYLEALADAVARPLPRTPTGFTTLDRLLGGGFYPGQLVLVGAATGMGKTALLLNLALAAARRGQRVFFWSGEMTIRENVSRLVAALAQVDVQRVIGQTLTPDESRAVTDAVAALRALPIVFNHGALTVNQLVQRARRHALRGLDVVLVDYLGLLQVPSQRERRLQLAEASWRCKLLAKDLNLTVIAAAQLNREFVRQADKRPGLHDFKESGDLENNADVVLGLYRDEVYNEATTLANVAEILLLKQRNGPRGKVYLHFDAPRGHFKGEAQIRQVDLSIKEENRD